MVYKWILKQIHKISTIAILAAIIGIITIGPAMADKDSSEGHNKIDICHFDKEDGKYNKISIPEQKAKGHNNHENDMIPAPEDGCPEQEESETESDDGINMDEFMEELTRHDEVISEITNSECSPGEIVTGFGPNGELICSPDNTGETNSLNIISRTDEQILATGDDLFKRYFCEPGEMMLGGLIEAPSMDPSLINGILVNNSEQSYVVTINKNNNQAVTVTVTYSCFVI